MDAAGASWLASPSPFVSDDVYKGVHFDARNLSDGFSLPGYRPAAAVGAARWVPAVAVAQAPTLFGPMAPHVFAPERIIAERHPIKLTTPEPGRCVRLSSVGPSSIDRLSGLCRILSLPAMRSLALIGVH